ncbi:metallo-endopeptidase [Bacillus phage vB_BboS-125]|uniref:Glycyl-glycine endopeptidase n=1 Tax=Bacillus phage vB_BboS-125 TaxID=2419618 RepID=A0A3G3BW47_9CAUD|nr:metallo-endopeptidase [Bacillus phage vB_BboS-125]AYP68390.1 glycyl-glycine endopeptidase precursor [Bacillus phage vB_BboS-125]
MITKTAAGFKVTTGFQEVSKLHPNGHTGLDIAIPEGTPLYSIGKGVVEKVVDYGDVNAGKTVIVQLQDGTRAVYGHLSEWAVETGDKIDAGQLLAYSGNTGRSTGAHLHISLQDQAGNYITPESIVDQALVQKAGFQLPSLPKLENPFAGTMDALAEFNEKLDAIGDWFIYWFNPVNLGTEIWDGMNFLIMHETTAYVLMGGTMAGIMLWALGANWPKKYVFWTWVSYWGFRMFVTSLGGM